MYYALQDYCTCAVVPSTEALTNQGPDNGMGMRMLYERLCTYHIGLPKG